MYSPLAGAHDKRTVPVAIVIKTRRRLRFPGVLKKSRKLVLEFSSSISIAEQISLYSYRTSSSSSSPLAWYLARMAIALSCWS